MIDRNQVYVFKNGEFPVYAAGNEYVGGSPVAMFQGQMTGDVALTGSVNYVGVAYNSKAEDEAAQSLGCFITAPAIVTLKKGENDAHYPWKNGLSAWALDQLLRPTTEVGADGLTYSVWSYESWSGCDMRFAEIIGLEGTSSVPTAITILLGYFPIQA